MQKNEVLFDFIKDFTDVKLLPCQEKAFYNYIKIIKGGINFMEMKYIIFYDDDYVTLSAKDTKDCIIKFAEYIDRKDDLFEKAIIGCDLHKDCVNLYNRMHSNTQIREISIIARTIYRDDIDGE